MLNKLVFVGMMGCGKTTLASRISEKLKWRFVDVDTFIEENYKAIPEIFNQVGEAGFRQLETKCLAEVLEQAPDLISTGGGLVTRTENVVLLKQYDYKIVYIKVDFEVLVKRLEFQRDSRPLLKSSDWKKDLYDLIAEREPIYLSVADEIVKNNDDSTETIIEDIISKIIYSK